MNPHAQSLLSDLDVTLTKASNVRRSDMLRRMTDLLLASAPSFPLEAVAIFDAVMQRLTQRSSRKH